MPGSCSDDWHMMARREFIKVTSAAVAGTVLVGWLPRRTEALENYPHWGKVIVVRNDAATEGPDINAEVVGHMLDKAIHVLTDGSGWRSLFSSYQIGETVAIKINAINPLK